MFQNNAFSIGTLRQENETCLINMAMIFQFVSDDVFLFFFAQFILKAFKFKWKAFKSINNLIKLTV